MSDLITHWAVFDDSRRLAAQDAKIEPFFKRILNEHRDHARLGAIARKGSQWMPHILRAAYARREEVAYDEKLQQRLAFALGGILHFPADHIFKPMMSTLAQADWEEAHKAMQRGQDKPSHREVSAYFDCHIFRKVYLAGEEEPFSRFLLADNGSTPGRELEAFIRALFQRALLSSHTLSPDMSNFDEWLDNLLHKIQPLYIDIELYTRVFSRPDPGKMKLYRVETEFYCDDDALIQLARHAQNGADVSGELDTALVSETRSGYAACLRTGVHLLRAASAFWRGERNEPPDVTQDMIWKSYKT